MDTEIDDALQGLVDADLKADVGDAVAVDVGRRIERDVAGGRIEAVEGLAQGREIGDRAARRDRIEAEAAEALAEQPGQQRGGIVELNGTLTADLREGQQGLVSGRKRVDLDAVQGIGETPATDGGDVVDAECRAEAVVQGLGQAVETGRDRIDRAIDDDGVDRRLDAGPGQDLDCLVAQTVGRREFVTEPARHGRVRQDIARGRQTGPVDMEGIGPRTAVEVQAFGQGDGTVRDIDGQDIVAAATRDLDALQRGQRHLHRRRRRPGLRGQMAIDVDEPGLRRVAFDDEDVVARIAPLEEEPGRLVAGPARRPGAPSERADEQALTGLVLEVRRQCRRQGITETGPLSTSLEQPVDALLPTDIDRSMDIVRTIAIDDEGTKITNARHRTEIRPSPGQRTMGNGRIAVGMPGEPDVSILVQDIDLAPIIGIGRQVDDGGAADGLLVAGIRRCGIGQHAAVTGHGDESGRRRRTDEQLGPLVGYVVAVLIGQG